MKNYMLNSQSCDGEKKPLSNLETAYGNLFWLPNSRGLSEDTDTHGG